MSEFNFMGQDHIPSVNRAAEKKCDCNYDNNYYGDQVCRASGNRVAVTDKKSFIHKVFLYPLTH